MTSRQLEYFRAVARELHFTRAAERLHVAQPALSQQIRKLERQIGLRLFDRDNHRVELTPAGTALLVHAERILSDLEAVEQEMHDWTAGTRGLIRLGTARALATPLARLVGRFTGVFPGIEIELREESTLAMIEDLRSGRLDVATLARRPHFDAGLEHRLLGREPLVLVTGLETPLARRRRIQVARLDGLDLILYGEGSAVRDVIMSALGAAGATPRVRFETREYRTARALASEGLAAAILPLSVAEEPGHPVHIIRLDPEPMWSAALAWPASRRPSPALTRFLAFVEAHFAQSWPSAAR